MNFLEHYLDRNGLKSPDGRPLYNLSLNKVEYSELKNILNIRLSSKRITSDTPAIFVLWASEYIRSHFEGGKLTWDFVFHELNYHEKNTIGKIGVEFTERGLNWWHRKVRISEGGKHLYLYSLMAEGGIPEALLIQKGLYGRIIQRIITNIEELGYKQAHRDAAQSIVYMPQSFQSEDILYLLIDIANALVKLRKIPPKDIPEEIIDQWLDINYPEWTKELPSRISKEIADTLIRPALRVNKDQKNSFSLYPIARRILLKDQKTKVWNHFIKLSQTGEVFFNISPESKSLRLLSNITNDYCNISIIYSAVYTDEGWRLNRIDQGSPTIPFDLEQPLIFTAYSDGRIMGEIEFLSSIPSPKEMPSLWKQDEDYENSNFLILLSSDIIKTKSSKIFILKNSKTIPNTSESITYGEIQLASNGFLFPLQGEGTIQIATKSWKISTNATEESPYSYLIPYGKRIPNWRLVNNKYSIFTGSPEIYGQQDITFLGKISPENLRISSYSFMNYMAEWVKDDFVIARINYLSFPSEMGIQLFEKQLGKLELIIDNFPPNLKVSLEAGDKKKYIKTNSITTTQKINISIDGRLPGTVKLHITEDNFQEITLIAAYPAQEGFILKPDNSRLEKNTSISLDDLYGYRVIIPENLIGEIQLRIKEQCIAIRAEGESSLIAYSDIIRTFLSQYGADSEVKLSIITSGKESFRLEIRRYLYISKITDNSKLILGLSRDNRLKQNNVFSDILTYGRTKIHAIDLKDPNRYQEFYIDAKGAIDLSTYLPEPISDWLIRPYLNKIPQRAIIWSSKKFLLTREKHIEQYKSFWKNLFNRNINNISEKETWLSNWKIIKIALKMESAYILNRVQALSYVPEAAIKLLFQVPKEDIDQVISLELESLIFWPILPFSSFKKVLFSEYEFYKKQFKDYESNQLIYSIILDRIKSILEYAPSLSAHLCIAFYFLISKDLTLLSETSSKDFNQLIQKYSCNPESQLRELEQQAARRYTGIPSGIKNLEENNSCNFNENIQKIINAPKIAAKISLGKEEKTTVNILTLINIRLLDPIYFDTALPFTLCNYLFHKGNICE